MSQIDSLICSTVWKDYIIIYAIMSLVMILALNERKLGCTVNIPDILFLFEFLLIILLIRHRKQLYRINVSMDIEVSHILIVGIKFSSVISIKIS